MFVLGISFSYRFLFYLHRLYTQYKKLLHAKISIGRKIEQIGTAKWEVQFTKDVCLASGGVDVWVGRSGDRRRVVGEVFRTFSPVTHSH
jgi:hypothetical protein